MNQITETIDSKYKKRIFQFIGFNEAEFKTITPAFNPDKDLMINDKWHVEIESHDTIEIIKLTKHKSLEYEK